MSKEVKISVIIPVYNVEKYITECLESVVHQSLEDIEIICIDDNSVDQSANIIELYARTDARIIYIRNTSNKGPSYARNVGLKHATGKYVYYLDSDDKIPTGALERLYTLAEQGNYQMIFFDFNSIYESETIEKQLGARYAPRKNSYEGEWTGEALFCEMVQKKEMPGTVWSQLFQRKYIVDKQLFFVEGILHEDIPYIVQATLQAEKVYYTDEKLYEWFHREQSITTSITSPAHIEGRVTGFMELMSFWKEQSWSDEINEIYLRYMNSLLQALRLKLKETSKDVEFFLNNPYKRYILDILKGKEEKFTISASNMNMLQNNIKILVYGTGKVAKLFIEKTYTLDIEIVGFAVTEKNENQKFFYGNEIREISDWHMENTGCLVVVAVSNRFHPEIDDQLEQLGYHNKIFIDYPVTEHDKV